MQTTGKSKEAVTEYLAGFLFGMTGIEDHAGIESCVQIEDPEDLASRAKAAVDEIARAGFFKGVHLFGKIIWSLPLILANCPNTVDQLLSLKSWSQALQHPHHLAE